MAHRSRLAAVVLPLAVLAVVRGGTGTAGAKPILVEGTRSLAGGTLATDLYTVRTDGSHLARLRGGSAAAQADRASDGTIAFVRAHALYVMRPDGTHARLLARAAANGHPSWSPDGSRIAYGSGGSLVVTSRSGRRLAAIPAGRLLGRPSWSPDGTRIAFSADGGRYGVAQVQVVGADGKGLARLMEFPGGASDPAWSPDGTALAFTAFPPQGGGMQLFIANADGSGPVQLTHVATDALQPDWSPDSQSLVFTKLVSGTRFAVATIRRDGTGERSVASAAGVAFENPDW